MRKKIFHNWGLKLGSLVLAYLLWLLVIQFDDPMESKTFRGIPVTLISTELLDQQDKVYDVLDGTDTVSVTVWAPRSIINDMDSSDIVAVADMSKLTEINSIAISFSVQNVDNKVENIKGNPDVLRLNVENRVQQWVNVRSSTTGEVAEGYMVTGVQLDQTQIRVTGPESAVRQIRYAGVSIDVSGATNNLSANVEVQFFDSSGNLLELNNVSKNANYVRMTVEILATKEVPVILNTMGTPADGYLATGEVLCDPPTVMIAGTSSALANINRISIPAEELDISGANRDVVKTINIRDLLTESNVRLADSSFNGNVTATVFIEPKAERTLLIDPKDISIVNAPADVKVQRPETEEPYRLMLSGLDSALSAVTADTLGARVDLRAWMEEQDLEELSPGVHRIPVTFTLPGDVKAENTVTVQIIIAKLEDM